MRTRSRVVRGFTLIELMIVIAIIAILAAVMIPNFVHARAQGQMSSCSGSLKTIGTALEMYANDNESRFATSLAATLPNYLRSVPTCPSAGSDTYTAGYEAASNPDSYTVLCTGNNHFAVGQDVNYPQYSSAAGLLTM